jgi:polysaccharide chain length determinant protein (PEP-CTERM system associated)
MNPELRYYLSVFVRRLPLFLLVALSISSSAIAFAVILPTVYSANAVLLVEQAQIPDELAASTVQVGAREQLQILQQRLMTRANLIEVARDFEVYEDIGLLNPDQVVNRMRDDTIFRSQVGREQATLLTIEFNGRTSAIAAGVANEFVTRVLADNARQRVRQAEDTLSFFEQEADRLGTELDLQSARILKFQNENADALPDSLDFRMGRSTLLQERLSQMARDRSLLEDQRARLVELFNRTGGVDPATAAATQTFEQRRLEELRNQLSLALAVYSEESPQVRLLRNQLTTLEQDMARQAASPPDPAQEPDAPAAPDATLLDLQLAEIDAQLEFMEEQFTAVQTELEELQDTIRRTPNNSIALEALQRDYENVQAQYNRAIDRLSAAVTGERIESLSKGERISVIEQAIAPTEPSKPNRPLIAAAGTTLGFGAATFLVVLLEVLNKSIRRPIDLTNGLGITPLATIPYISTRGEKLRRRLLILTALAVVLIGIPAALYVIHYQIMPLDLVVDKVLERIRF